MKNQALFSSKDKSKKLIWCLLQFLLGALRVRPSQGDTSVLSPLSCSSGSLYSCCVYCVYLSYTYSPVLQFQLPALLLVCVLFILFLLFVVVLSGEPRQKQGRELVDHKLVQAPHPQ